MVLFRKELRTGSRDRNGPQVIAGRVNPLGCSYRVDRGWVGCVQPYFLDCFLLIIQNVRIDYKTRMANTLLFTAFHESPKAFENFYELWSSVVAFTNNSLLLRYD